METRIESPRLAVLHRAIALGLAFATTSFLATSVAVIFTGNTHTVGAALARVAIAPVRALLGG